MSIDEMKQRILDIQTKVEELQPLFAEMTRDALLEAWEKRGEEGRYNEPVAQLAIKTALRYCQLIVWRKTEIREKD